MRELTVQKDVPARIRDGATLMSNVYRRAIGVTGGVIRASDREAFTAPGVIRPAPAVPVEPWEIHEYTIDLWATRITFLAGRHPDTA